MLTPGKVSYGCRATAEAQRVSRRCCVLHVDNQRRALDKHVGPSHLEAKREKIDVL
jgi:hypothetical protein